MHITTLVHVIMAIASFVRTVAPAAKAKLVSIHVQNAASSQHLQRHAIQQNAVALFTTETVYVLPFSITLAIVMVILAVLTP